MTSSLNLAKALDPIISRVRTDVCAVKKSGNIFWTRQPLLLQHLADHIEGQIGRGVCPIKAGENKTSVALLDLDSHKGQIDWTGMVDRARTISSLLKLEGLITIPFKSSGGKGIHLYVIWDLPQDAYSVRHALKRILAKAGYSNGTAGVARGQIEIFPKQASVENGKFGSQFILPLHNKSVPIDLTRGIDLKKEGVLNVHWQLSEPVEVITATVLLRPVELSCCGLDRLKDMLTCIDPDCSYDDWIRVGMATHYETGGSADGLFVFDEWSAGGSDYPGREAVEKKWESLGTTGKPLTGRFIEQLARSSGYTADILEEFEDNSADSESPWPVFERDSKGKIIITRRNLQKGVACKGICGHTLVYDQFRDEVLYQAESSQDWKAMSDPTYFRVAVAMEEKGFKTFGKEMLREAVDDVAKTNQIDSAIDWLASIPDWDGVSRIERFLIDYMGSEDNAYVKAVGNYLWSALVGRIREPGCKADMSVILVGPQGVGKSRGIAALVPFLDWFAEVSFSESEDNIARKLRGRVIAEIAELRGLHSKDVETIKAFITRTHENWVPKYKEHAIKYARRTVFIGSTNQNELFADETGNRRWLPVEVSNVDVDQIIKDRLQLWAEANALYISGGIAWQDAANLARTVTEEYQSIDPWHETIEAWVEAAAPKLNPSDSRHGFTSDVIYRDALGFEIRNVKKYDKDRVAKIMRVLGFTKKRRRDGRRQLWVWERA